MARTSPVFVCSACQGETPKWQGQCPLCGEWNTLEMESRVNLIRVRLNGEVVAQSPGDPQRPKTGPIGLQLHDQFTFAMFRNIRIREAVAPISVR